jgi:hypothetical protein
MPESFFGITGVAALAGPTPVRANAATPRATAEATPNGNQRLVFTTSPEHTEINMGYRT